MPLWAMLVAVLIALYPQLQHYLFFREGGFVRGSVIYAIQTCGDVSIPLILVILGANLANDDEITHSTGEDSETAPVTNRKWTLTQRQRGIILGIATRMIIVPLIICPLTIPVALWGVRYHMGVLCDPIFWVVCWLLVGSPTAVQLTQITQLNDVFEGEMATVRLPPLTLICVTTQTNGRCYGGITWCFVHR
jgi:auxin efflux carrier family protein